jgi:EAL domain-containing protein (putative c-di-GMP-specific phosphodiesterase class I)
MNGAFSILIERTGEIHGAEGEPGLLRTMLPDWSGGRTLFSLFPKQQHNFINDILHSITPNTEGRISDLSMLTADGKLTLFHLTVLPAGPGRWTFGFVPSDSQASQEPTVIWIDFFDSVSYLVENAPDKPIELMMLSFEALDDSRMIDQIGKNRMDTLRAAIEASLNNAAVNGQIGRLDNTSYVVMYDADIDADDIVHNVGDATQELGISVEDLGARTHAMALDSNADAEQVQAALAHVRRSFLNGDDGDIEEAPKSLNAAIEQIEISKRQIIAALDAGNIVLRRYPVTALATGEAVVHLMHGALVIDGESVLASRRLILGDYPGLALQHDLVMTREAILRIAAARDQNAPIDPVIIDIEAASLAATDFESGVAKMMKVAGVAPQSIGFRVLSLDLARQTQPGYQSLVRMLERGHPAWLTRFANAVTNSTLKGAYIEVTATYLQRLCENADGRDLVSQLLEIWRNAGVRLVAIDVQSSDQVGLVNDLKIEYAIAPTASQ